MEIVYHGKWGKARHDYPCAPLEIRPQQVRWYGADWYLPAVYACAQGMVFHLFSSVPEEEFRAFYDRWAARAEELDRMEAEQAEAAPKKTARKKKADAPEEAEKEAEKKPARKSTKKASAEE